jgi:hypothetical protein
MRDKTAFHSQPKKCPAKGKCDWLMKTYLVAEDPIRVDKIQGAFANITYKNMKGKVFSGWVPTLSYEPQEPPRKNPSLDFEEITQECRESSDCENGSSSRYRFRVDLNGDGLEDLLFSVPAREFGTGGGTYDVYLQQKSGLYLKIGAIVGHPMAVTFRKDRHKGLLASYSHGSASGGVLFHYTVEDEDIRMLNEKAIDSEDFEKELLKNGAKYLHSETGRVKAKSIVWTPDELPVTKKSRWH